MKKIIILKLNSLFLKIKKQKIQDYLTQLWVSIGGREITPLKEAWLIGPLGKVNGIGKEFVYQLAKEENLIIEESSFSRGLLSSIKDLNLSTDELAQLDKDIIDFYEYTSDYDVLFSLKWNPLFKCFGFLVGKLFSNRINQLNIPANNISQDQIIDNKIIHLISPHNKEVKHTIWFRTFKDSDTVLYSGIYSICSIPSGKTCIKAVFPLPNGSATVILSPEVGSKGELILNSKGKQFGEAGFYFLLKNLKEEYRSKYISTFHDRLVVYKKNNELNAIQKLKLWHLNVLTIQYKLSKRKELVR